MDNIDLIQQSCPHCGVVVQASDSFCGTCGREVATENSALSDREDAFTVLSPTLFYYGITLLLLATYKLTTFFPDGFEGLVTITLIDTVIVFTFTALFFRQLKPLFSFQNVSPKLVVLIAACAIAGAAVVSVVADLINISISEDVFYSTYLFEDTNHPLLFAILFIAVHPAIFEEVAFRGFLYDNLTRLATPQNAIYITGFIFGIIHLAIISMLWLVPIGIIFAWLRWKYNTLWYGMVGHFVYNFSITIIEYNGWTFN